MNIAEYSIRNQVISWTFAVLLLLGGVISFLGLGQLEFPEFPVPKAMVNTLYPGASPEQVEEEVTLPIERAIQELEYIKHIDSISSAGVSQITVELKATVTKKQHPQVWDELRRKVNDVQSRMPQGVFPSQVNDDFSDVFGIMLTASGQDFSYRELEDYADLLQRELSLVKGVKKVQVVGKVDEQIVIEISEAKVAALGIDPAWISSLIQNQNVVSNAGRLFIDGFSVRIHPTGEFESIDELKQLVVSSPKASGLVYLGDIAEIYRTFVDTPTNLYRSNGQKALSLGISFAKGVNVVDVAQAVDQRLSELEERRPVGIDLNVIYNQPEVVKTSVNDFLISLLESIVIVIVVLLFAMGFRSGVLMGTVLLLTILGTFIGMKLLSVQLQLISLGALIIALGMLVDNAIVITEGVLVGLQRRLSRIQAISQVVAQNIWPLLGATLIAIIAFAPIGLSANATGDFMISLFQVMSIALFISWVLAVTLTPFFCNLMFKDIEGLTSEGETDPYKGGLFVLYKQFLTLALKHRLTSLVLTLLALVLAVAGFGHVKQAFFPPSNTPIFFIDIWFQEGTDIRETEKQVERIEADVVKYKGVENVTATIGAGGQRFILTYSPEKVYSSYAQLIVEVDERDTIHEVLPGMRKALNDRYPEAEFKFKLLKNGPTPAANIEARFYGSDPDVLRKLGAKAIAVMEAMPGAHDIRHSWREPVQVVRPRIDEAAARRSGISKKALDETLLNNFTGHQIGTYRDGSHLLPIVTRAPEDERLNADRIDDLVVWSQERNAFVPVGQAVMGFEAHVENPLIVRRDLKRVLTVMADVDPFSGETPESLRSKMKDKIEAIPLPYGYSLEWGGEYETAGEAKTSLFSSLPMGYLIMFLITIFLFNTIRQPLAIWSTVPLALIGVAAGLLLFNMPFTFTALLGLLSLSGMLVKNGIVLVEQMNIEMAKEISVQQAIIDAAVSRVRPVSMAALTTMLGMIPLVFDAFFSSMAVTIIFGLGFATVLTLIVLPVVYALLYRVRFDQ